MKTLTIIQPIRDALKHLALASALGAGLGVTCAQAAIPVGVGGSGTLTFDTLPANTEWSTVSIAGNGGTATSLAALDTLVSGLAASGITTTLATISGDPGAITTTLGTYSTGNQRLTSRAGTTAATCFLATLQNTSGAAINELNINFTLSGSAPAGEDAGMAGYTLYCSLTGAASSWQRIGVYGTLGAVNATASLSSAWEDTTMLYVLWVDDNGNNGGDGWYAFDDVSFAKAAPSANIMTFGLPGNPAVITGTNIYLTVPDGTIVTALAPTFTMSYGASCTHGVTGDPIVSGVTPVDFTSPVHYTVTSEAPVVTKDYTVQVAFLPVITYSQTYLNISASATGVEILNDAALVEANHFYGTNAPITLANGLTFGTSWSHTSPAGWSGGQNTSTDGYGIVPLLTDATPYGKLMRNYTWSSVSNHYLTIPGLIPGHTYRLQLISVAGKGAGVQVEASSSTTWADTSAGHPSVLTAIWIQSPGDTELNVVLTRNSSFSGAHDNELAANGYALHDLSVLPAAPTGLAAAPLVGEIRLTWTPAAGVAHYNVKRALAPGGPYLPESVIGTPTGPLFNDFAVTNGVTYYYVVSTTNFAGESLDNSNEVSSSPTVTKADQSITFALGLSVTKTVDDTAFSDPASATSLLPVTYSVHPDDATIASVDPDTGMVTILRVPGTARILADQGGNTSFNPAPQVEQLLTVTQVMPVLTWSTPRAIAEGTPLSGTQLNATCTVPGTFTYTPDVGEVLAVGSHTLSVHFAPDEPIPYGTPEDKTVTLTVGSPAGPTVINVNYGLASNASMNGIYSFDPVAKGSASQPAPAAYGGNVWNDFGWPSETGSLDLQDSFGASTGVGFSWGPGAVSSPYNDWSGLGFNRLLISGRFLNSTTYAAVFTLTGLNASHKYDLYIASLHNTEVNSIDFQAVGAVTTALHCQYVNATDWVAGQDYVKFAAVVPAADGTLVVNAQRPGGGYLNGFQLVDLGSGTAGYGTWANANAGDGAPNEDFNNDGVQNGIAYFMGMNGLATNPGITGNTVTWPNGGNILAADYGTQFVVQTSSDLMNWVNVASDDTNLINTDTSISYTLPHDGPKLFVRLVVTPTP